ncbi:putative protease YdcP precursor [Methanobrevibacter cuticularis]|uniref:Putative protease YdcP n=1 Tax=Methanobrevibacter cuticularis TaxID=47311 RepID=A0A166CVH2_9EURY|nr:peptidase U32 family protein [Methanobrevibacter cuticularis]KZX17107.1 putative protease YdcP precursor [Methanobrevibacter cuticularis]
MVELLSPAGNFISLRAALENGADSVYIGFEDTNMRSNVSNFSIDDIKKASSIAKEYSSKIYLCTNTVMKDEDIKYVESNLERIKEYEVDALIVSDIGLVDLVVSAGLEPHMSVQENISNSYALKTLKKLGVTRAILSRELNIEDINKIASNSPIETEIFIHGAMCMAISGRCFLSYGLYGKSANCGECLQPCRKQWKIAIFQDENSQFCFDDNDSTFILEKSLDGSYKSNFTSPNDMSMIEHIPELMSSGVDAFKIEGRARSPDYVATTTKVYREAIDSYTDFKRFEVSKTYKFNPQWVKKLKNVFNRGFDTGFYFKDPYKTSNDNQSNFIKKDIGKVVNYYSKVKVAELQLWDDLSLGDKIMIQGPTTGSITHTVESMEIDNKAIDYCKKGHNVAIAIDTKVRENDFIYKLIERESY